MSLIYIGDRQGRQVSYEAHEAQRLWHEGAIARDALYWREGMAEWRPAVECFESVPAQPAHTARPPAIPSLAQQGFVKDPVRLTRILVGLLWAYLGAAALGALITTLSLATGQAGNATAEELTALDIAGMLVGFPQMLSHQSHWAAQPAQSLCALCRQPMAATEMIFLNHHWVCARCKPIAVQQLREGVADP